MSEQKIQKRIIDDLTKKNWMVIKLMKTSINGIPDLMALRNGTTKFIEVKKPGGTISVIQQYRIKELRKQGFEAVVMDGVDSIIY